MRRSVVLIVPLMIVKQIPSADWVTFHRNKLNYSHRNLKWKFNGWNLTAADGVVASAYHMDAVRGKPYRKPALGPTDLAARYIISPRSHASSDIQHAMERICI